MEELKQRVKMLVPENKHPELDQIFHSWLASLKVHTIPDVEEGKDCEAFKEKKLPEKEPLKLQIEALKKQIGKFKEKMKAYKESNSSSTELAFEEVKEEIRKVKEEISKLKLKISFDNQGAKQSENAELIQKLDEVKQFLEKLK